MRGLTRRRSLGLAAAALLGGCASPLMGGEDAPPDTYRLTAPDLSGDALPRTEARLVVGDPAAAPGLESGRIAVVQQPQSLDYYADARWAEPAPDMIKAVLVEALQTSGGLAAVGRRSVAIDPTVRLRTEIIALQAAYRPGETVPTARVGLHATLIAQPGRAVLGSQRFEADARPASAALTDVVAALDRAADEAVAGLVRWTLDRLAAGA